MLDRLAIAGLLREIALLSSLERGGNRFKARAYERGADVLEHADEAELGARIREGKLTDLEGIGPALASTISELFRTGTAPALTRLRGVVPRGLIELSQIDGLTEKRIDLLVDAGIDDLDKLRAALAVDAIRAIKGFGAKTEDKIRAGIEKHDRGDERQALVDALPAGERLARHLAAGPGVLKVELAGPLRRGHEALDAITLIATGEDPEPVVERFASQPAVIRVFERDASSAKVSLAGGARAELSVVASDRFGVGHIVHTGSAEHVAALEARAQSRGLSLATMRYRTEEEVYSALDLPYFPPERRDGALDVESLASLIAIEDVRGMIHVHSTYSDGRDTIEALALEADRRGVEYLTITDHSPSAFYAQGVAIDHLQRQWDEIAEVQTRVKVKLLRGTESDINADGSLDYPDAILEQLDVVIASIHSRHQMDAAAMTARLVRAMKHPVFKIWGHALGRLVLKRDPIRCDMDEVLDAIASSRAAIEINGDPHRLDLAPEWIPAARARKIPFVVSVDAHSAAAFGYLPFGISMARRGGLQRSEVLNTRSATEFAAAVRPGA